MVQQQLCNVLVAILACNMQGCPAILQGAASEAREQLVVERHKYHGHKLQVLLWQCAMICTHPDECQWAAQQSKDNTPLWKQGCQQQ